MTDANKLRMLADWFNLYDKNQTSLKSFKSSEINQVQKDLREMARKLKKIGGNIPDKE